MNTGLLSHYFFYQVIATFFLMNSYMTYLILFNDMAIWVPTIFIRAIK